MPFPVVTICNSNMFKLDKIVPVFNGTADFFTKGLRFIRELFPDKGLTNLHDDDDVTNQKSDIFNLWKRDMRELVTLNGHDKTDMIVSCRFNMKKCGPQHFEKTLTNFGVCYKFRLPPMEVNNSGLSNGLSLILNAEHLQYVAAPREKVGFRVSITAHDHTTDVASDGLDIAVGMSTSIGLRRRFIKLLPAPFSDCVEITTNNTSKKPDDLTFSMDEHYSKSRCIQNCETNYFVELCKCLIFFSSNVSDSVPFCLPLQYKNCYSNNIDIFAREKHRICNCPEPCEMVDLQKTLSSSNYPSLSVARTLYMTKKLEHFGRALGWKIRQVTFANSEKKREFIIKATPSFLNTTFQGHQINEASLQKHLRKIAVDVFGFVEVEITDKMFEVRDWNRNLTISVNSKFYDDVKERAHDHVLDFSNAMTGVLENMFTNHSNISNSGTQKYFETFFDNLFDSIFVNVSTFSEEAANDLERISSDVERTTEYMRHTFARLDVFYEDLRMNKQIDRARYSLTGLLGNLGGTLGLFFGASLLAFIEAMEFWFLNDSCRRKKQKSVHSHV
ncbi:acid-sensing ion channel 1A-like [Antedon mediterranea]|uniref:acid-sensing ion channel 1A-like n=1 Tax=Antedon mediterranea TaxID=105859 RepID=UPI003AF67D28